jgi:hypothetical protein
MYLALLCSCGKHETAAGTLGAASGAIVGSAVSGGNSKGTGALVGAMIGNLFGREIGKEADKQESEEIMDRARQRALARRRLERLEAENRALRESHTKWCFRCSKKVHIIGAHTCPRCGGELGREKFCNGCTASFEPESGFRYCPFCKDRALLSIR